MRITAEQFLSEAANTENKHRRSIALIGMSGIGKSGRTKGLQKIFGYHAVEVDDLIGKNEKLLTLIEDYEGDDTAAKLGNWLGMPWEKDFKEREELYLLLEREIMREIAAVQSSILDLTGSAIYHPKELEAIRKESLVVYLKADEDLRNHLQETYLERPKPVCWNGLYEREKGESKIDAIGRLYPTLVRTREELYTAYADVILKARPYKKKPIGESRSTQHLVEDISSQLPSIAYWPPAQEAEDYVI